ncbi:copper resistance protein CopC [Curtobacterium sp. RHCJP20]|uniref:Copper resistance protein CopC n=1 Tax=Curtobacterium subtropicum TaxID=3055138 RepID=A0ABT7TM77_9MICO|nr:copper resistance CopC family protein [Curtobacterium subtropicum]MDM7889994.1 copper resistance protein CopC [Curtobacterium subtropicum]
MRLRALLATVVVAAFAPVLLVAGPASAHDVLVASDPVADATVAGDVDHVLLTLSEPPLSGLQTGIVISVTDAEGAEHTSGDVSVQGNTIAKDLDVSEAGSYLVRWRSVSVDGHPISGEYRFRSSGPAALDSSTDSGIAETPAPSATAAPTATARADDASGIRDDMSATTAAAPAGGHQHHTILLLIVALVVVGFAGVVGIRALLARRDGVPADGSDGVGPDGDGPAAGSTAEDGTRR